MLSQSQNLALQSQNESSLLHSNEKSDDDEGQDNSDDETEDEKAYTLAIIVNADFDYNEVAETWMIYSESMQR